MIALVLDGVPQHGTYVVAVSGGVDSTVLLYLLRRQRPGLRVIVAHVEHGIRGHASREDALYVKELAASLNYTFELLQAGLGPDASEEGARTHRYAFLEQLVRQYGAIGIMTAHHQDDVLETICLNILRGTGWRGLCSLRSTPHLLRPLLKHPKADIIAFAQANRIVWRHDVTNDSMAYTRNRLRRHVIPSLAPDVRDRLVHLWDAQCGLRSSIEAAAEKTLQNCLIHEEAKWAEISRYRLIMLPRTVAHEVMRATALRVAGRSLLHSQLERMLLFAAAAKPGSRLSAGSGVTCRSTRRGIVVGSA